MISEWRKQRDAGVLAGKRPGEKVGRLTAEQAEIARLTRELARANKRLSTTEAALDIMGKHTLSWRLSSRERIRRAAQESMTHTYMSLIAGGVSTRHAAVLTAMVRSTATRRLKNATAPTARPAGDPVNKLTDLERRRDREVLTSDRFVDLGGRHHRYSGRFLADDGPLTRNVATKRAGRGSAWINWHGARTIGDWLPVTADLLTSSSYISSNE